MPVHPDHPLCRFVKGQSDCWDPNENRPRVGAFKDKRFTNISVWDVEELGVRGVSVEVLRIGPLSDHGQALLTVQDYLDAAKEAGEERGVQLDIEVEWRPDETSTIWREWAYAHVQVEYSPDEKFNSAIKRFRQILARKAWNLIPPARYANDS